MILWLTGQPGSGKTTLAKAFIERVTNDNPDIKIINIDGDDLRHISNNKDYSKHQDYLFKLLKSYYKKTNSINAKNIIDNYKEEIKNFMMVKPKASNYKDLLNLLTKVA